MPVHAKALREGLSVETLSPDLRERLDKFVAYLDEKVLAHDFDGNSILEVYAGRGMYQDWMFPILESMYGEQGWELRKRSHGKLRFEIAPTGTMEERRRRDMIDQQLREPEIRRERVIMYVRRAFGVLLFLLVLASIAYIFLSIGEAVASVFQQLFKKFQ